MKVGKEEREEYGTRIDRLRDKQLAGGLQMECQKDMMVCTPAGDDGDPSPRRKNDWQRQKFYSGRQTGVQSK